MLHIPLDLDRAGAEPLYQQLYEGLAGQIRTGAIPAGGRLPGKRTLAAELSLSVSPIGLNIGSFSFGKSLASI